MRPPMRPPPLCLLVVGIIIITATTHAALTGDATTWNSAQVNEWVDTLNTASATAIKAGVTKHGITGNILLVLDDSDLHEELGVTVEDERRTIFAAITALQDSDSTQNAKLSFWELRALNRQQVDYVTPLLTMAPRWAITTFDDFPEYCRPASAVGENFLDWLEWALVPEWYIWSNRDTIMCGLPGFVPYICLLHLIFHVYSIAQIVFVGSATGAVVGGSFLGAGGGAAGGLVIYILNHFGSELIVFCLSWILSATLWRILPWFINDFLFYLFVYVLPFLQTIQYIQQRYKQQRTAREQLQQLQQLQQRQQLQQLQQRELQLLGQSLRSSVRSSSYFPSHGVAASIIARADRLYPIPGAKKNNIVVAKKTLVARRTILTANLFLSTIVLVYNIASADFMTPYQIGVTTAIAIICITIAVPSYRRYIFDM